MHRALATQDPFAQFRRNFFGIDNSKTRTETKLSLNVYEDGGSYLVRTKIPGFDVSEIEIEVVKNQVTIRGERSEDTGEEKLRLHRQERSFLNFERTFSLPKTVNVDTIHANFRNGFLEIILEWDEAAKPKTVKITQGDA